jgi:mannosylglucosylglycerate synthase
MKDAMKSLFNNKKKVALVHFAYPPNVGGVEILVKEHADFLISKGFMVKILTGSGKDDQGRIKVVQNDKFASLGEYRPEMQESVLSKGIINDSFMGLAKDIESVLEKELRYVSTLIIHNVMTVHRNLPLNMALREYAKKHKEINILVWVHDHVYINEEKVKEDLGHIYHSPEINKLLTEPIIGAKYIVVSDVLKQVLLKVMKIDPTEVLVIPGGVAIKKTFGIADDLWSWISYKDILNRFPVFISPANILERKNIEYAIDLVYEIKKKHPHTLLIISGKTSVHRNTDEYYSKLKKKVVDLGIKDNVSFISEELHTLSYSELTILYRLSTAVFYFSKSENFGIPVIEAAVHKTPIFTSDLRVFKEIAGDAIYTIDSNKESPDSAAERVIDLLNSDKVVLLNRVVKEKYHLERILEEKLLPLIR